MRSLRSSITKSVFPALLMSLLLAACGGGGGASGVSDSKGDGAAGGEGAKTNTWVLGYYVGYQANIQPPAAVDYSAMTHIVLGAALPLIGGTWNTDFYIDAVAGPAWAKQTVGRAHAAGIKALLMLGGAGNENIAAFRTMSDPGIRSTFVANLKAIIDAYGFDGFDVDWEPLELSGDDDDRARVLAFSQALRAAMPGKIMTLPTGWNNMNLDNALNPFFGTLSAYYDRINIMSYEMIWCGDGWRSWHFGALYGQTPDTPSSVDNTVHALIDSGVPKGKIGIGIGFYGVPIENGGWQNGTWFHSGPPYVTGPRQNTDSAGWRFSDNWVSFSNIMHYYYAAGARQWDDVAKAPYLSFASPRQVAEPSWANPPIRTTYVTYEDEQSIAAKGKYVKAMGLGGTIVWTISEGYLEWQGAGEKDPLMKAVAQAFLN